MSRALRTLAHEFRYFGNRAFLPIQICVDGALVHILRGGCKKDRPYFSQRIYYSCGLKSGKNIRVRVEGTLIMNLLFFQNYDGNVVLYSDLYYHIILAFIDSVLTFCFCCHNFTWWAVSFRRRSKNPKWIVTRLPESIYCDSYSRSRTVNSIFYRAVLISVHYGVFYDNAVSELLRNRIPFQLNAGAVQNVHFGIRNRLGWLCEIRQLH